MTNFLFILFFLNIYKCKLFNLQQDEEKDIQTEFGICRVISCGEEICAIGDNGFCDKNENRCLCQADYITFKKEDDISESPYKCCYQQKSELIAIVLEFVIGFGIGHFYIGNITLGLIKLIVYLTFFLSVGMTLLKMYLSRGEEKSFLFKILCTSCLLGCSCTYIVWQIIDVILFSIESYRDGNGQPLHS